MKGLFHASHISILVACLNQCIPFSNVIIIQQKKKKKNVIIGFFLQFVKHK